MNKIYRAGIDIGSTTIKIVLTDAKNDIIFADYRRHNADIKQSVLNVFAAIIEKLGDIKISIVITGSAGMGIAEKFHIPFVQEVIAATEVIHKKFPTIKTLIDIGGEDAKMIFFHKDKTPDIRMNGSCAGGTGAFIDQMASLLGITLEELNALASNYTNIYPIASRCGVFTKTDIQNLIAKNTKREDIAASIFNAVAMQTITSLARGYDVEAKVFFCGGPFAFLSELKNSFARQLNLTEQDYIVSDKAEFIPAWGSALVSDIERLDLDLSALIYKIQHEKIETNNLQNRLEPLFKNSTEYESWKEKKDIYHIERCNIKDIGRCDIKNIKDIHHIERCNIKDIKDTHRIGRCDIKDIKDTHHIERCNIKDIKDIHHIERCNIKDINTDENTSNSLFFLGVDSGSTTTKIVITDSSDKILFTYYTKNNGNPLEAIKDGLASFNNIATEAGKIIRIARTAVTGYGEDLVKAAYNLDYGIVETIAHFTAAKKFNPNVSFILDIGGQDMKAIFVTNSIINKLEINEACSSGCGSFIEGFANGLNYTADEFANKAVTSKNPCDLGTRCTVFMNSKVKQFLREGASVADIAAGLSYSVVKNCLYKVLKIKDVAELGDNIIVQGGTFRNKSVIRALELLTNKNVICTDLPELMGAYGAAIYAKEQFLNTTIELTEVSLEAATNSSNVLNLPQLQEYHTNQFNCKGCENLCLISTLSFNGGTKFVTGNKCEKVYANSGSNKARGENHYNFKLKRLTQFEKPATINDVSTSNINNISENGISTSNISSISENGISASNINNINENDVTISNLSSISENRISASNINNISENRINIGIPRVLNMYENFPFWSELFHNCGLNVTLSTASTYKQYERGISSVMSDNICFPAKLVHGHIYDLIDSKVKVDRIFFPFVVYETKEHPAVVNSYNCPVVTGYGEVLKSSMDLERKYGIPIDSPSINFDDVKLLKKSCYEYLKNFGIKKNIFNKAFDKAQSAFSDYKNSLKQNCERILANASTNNRIVLLVAGRPYHTDQLIQHKLTDMISDFDVDVISDDFVRLEDYSSFSDLTTVSQWTYTNRIMRAAKFVGENQNNNIHFVQITSFGCGPDAFVIDEVSDILKSHNKNFTVLKVDDVNNIGSLKLRVRSLLETLKFNHDKENTYTKSKKTPVYTDTDKKKTILAPFFSEIYSPFLPTIFKLMGYDLTNLPSSDEQSIELGLKYANNEICYPATLVIGDVIKALNSGNYDLNNIVIGMTQTGGQCRASNYIMLIKKALIAAGFDNIPVISVTFSSGIYEQQAFKLNFKSNIKITIYATLFADSISKIYYSAVAREKIKGTAIALRNKYINAAQKFITYKDSKGLLQLLKKATDEFNSIIDEAKNPPKIGIVGEIYVKYNSIGHKNIVKWLVEQDVEVVMPPLLSFFIQWFVNNKTNISHNLKNKGFWNFLSGFFKKILDKSISKVDNIAANYKYWRPFGDIEEESHEAQKVITLAAQFGEGWLIPAEISNFAKHNVKNVVSLQPFGCIANHIISKGVEKRIKEVFPKMNLLFLDFDSGVSDVNVHNRLHFMIKNAKH